MLKKLYVNSKFVGMYKDQGECSIGYTSYQYFTLHDYEVIIKRTDVEAMCIGDDCAIVITKGRND